MEDNKQKKNEQRMGEPNPTVNAPGSKVADYGDVEGGEGAGDERSHRTTDKADRGRVEPLKGKDETLGTP
ncbi:hypothetical protein [Flavisolibacter ginsenosidimutans]|uniref:Uncharacterized protein n=1 Tax=Flavisolibacter ginsenosidimutans TaxID=661481 RepID=A0A5B8UPN2_9BACT|nr:hypothetical protein [Flavisolibacter ginsenosidimutans]QEC58199.1 hypothetical protein FSB75_20590 [Flavisolibacter ginsenosidimutans]